MAWTRPTLPELVDQTQQDFVSRLGLSGSVLRRSMVYVLSRVFAGLAHMLYGYLAFLARQLFPDLSEDEYLLRQGRPYIGGLLEAEFSTGDVVITGVNGTVIPEDTVLLRSDGVRYLTDAEATIASGEAVVEVTAEIAAADGDCDAGTVLTFESPIDDVDAEATVDTGGLVDGSDEEDIENYRIRFMERLSRPPQGGSDADYKAWAKEVSGVTRVWVYRHELGVGSVTIRFMRDDDVDPIPSAGEVTSVQEYIDDETRKPVTATVYVVAPVAVPLDLEIELTPDTTATRAAVIAELEDMLTREAEPGGTVTLSSVRTAIGIAAGVTDYELDLAADVTHTTGQICTLGDITWL